MGFFNKHGLDKEAIISHILDSHPNPLVSGELYNIYKEYKVRSDYSDDLYNKEIDKITDEFNRSFGKPNRQEIANKKYRQLERLPEKDVPDTVVLAKLILQRAIHYTPIESDELHQKKHPTIEKHLRDAYIIKENENGISIINETPYAAAVHEDPFAKHEYPTRYSFLLDAAIEISQETGNPCYIAWLCTNDKIQINIISKPKGDQLVDNGLPKSSFLIVPDENRKDREIILDEAMKEYQIQRDKAWETLRSMFD